MIHRPVLIAALVLAAAAPSTLGQVTPTFSDIPYGDGHPRQRLDVYLPPGGQDGPPLPTIVWIHGGGWQNGDKSSAAGRAAQLMPLGFAVVGINYRLSGDASHPAQIHDCKGAVRWLRAHAAEYNLDASRFGAWGSSAGGHLVALVGTSGNSPSLEGAVGGNTGFSSAVRAVADYFGPADFLTITSPGHLACNSPESLMLGACLGDVVANMNNPDWADEVALVNSASPTFHVDPTDPPFHIAHGTADPVVEPAQSQVLFDALTAAGVPAALRFIPGAGHGLPPGEDMWVRRFFLDRLNVPKCGGDFNATGAATTEDIFVFLGAWFAGSPAADIDESGDAGVPDIFAFLAAWFAGC